VPDATVPTSTMAVMLSITSAFTVKVSPSHDTASEERKVLIDCNGYKDPVLIDVDGVKACGNI
jgi:hypothetical protein